VPRLPPLTIHLKIGDKWLGRGSAPRDAEVTIYEDFEFKHWGINKGPFRLTKGRLISLG